MAGPSKGLTKPRRARKCTGCGMEHTKGEMLRVVRSPDGVVSIDASGRAQGRGAYICRNSACLAHARKKNAFARVLKHPVDRSFYDEVAKFLGEPDDE
ncbi:MAG: YlxR family protein [Synergistaceae bacterium]|nr:YlxR family protein [Synergistaceae bacterium]